MPWSTEAGTRYRRVMSAPGSHTAYNPLVAKYPMSWPPRGCNWCGDEEMIWAYPVGHVNFPRVNPADGEELTIGNHAQQWYACARCKTHIDEGRLDELAEILGKPQGYWDPLIEAKLQRAGTTWGMSWTRRRMKGNRANPR
jgi:hypothetical protein